MTSTGDSAFSNCSNLATVTFAEGSQLESIGDRAFYNCSSLTSITLPSSLIKIGSGAFESCDKLTTVVIESEDIYKVATSAYYAGYLLYYATTVKVLKTIDGGSNTFLSTTGGYTLDDSSDPKYNIYTK